MNSIPEMIEFLRNSPVVVGLAEYGSASSLDERIDGDYDLIVIVDIRLPDVESLHFYEDRIACTHNSRTGYLIPSADSPVSSLSSRLALFCSSQSSLYFQQRRFFQRPA